MSGKEKVVPEEEIKVTVEYKGKTATEVHNFTDMYLEVNSRDTCNKARRDAARRSASKCIWRLLRNG